MENATLFLDSVRTSLQSIPWFTTPDHPGAAGWPHLVDTSQMYERWLGMDPALHEETRELLEAVGDLCGEVSKHAMLARQLYAHLALRCGDRDRAAAVYGVTADAVLLAMKAELDDLNELRALDEQEEPAEIDETSPQHRFRLVHDPPADEDEPLPDEDEPLPDDGSPCPPDVPGPEWQPKLQPIDETGAEPDDEPTFPRVPASRQRFDAAGPRRDTLAAWRAGGAVVACLTIAAIAVVVVTSPQNADDVASRSGPAPDLAPPHVEASRPAVAEPPAPAPAAAPVATTTEPESEPETGPEPPGEASVKPARGSDAVNDAVTPSRPASHPSSKPAGETDDADQSVPPVKKQLARAEQNEPAAMVTGPIAPRLEPADLEEFSSEITVISPRVELAPITEQATLRLTRPHRDDVIISVGGSDASRVTQRDVRTINLQRDGTPYRIKIPFRDGSEDVAIVLEVQ